MRSIKFYIFLVTLLCSVNTVWSQDIIILKNTEEINAVVLEVGLTDVIYKKHENPNGPSYTLLKSDIFMIRYANGEKDIFKDEPPVSTTGKPQKGLSNVPVPETEAMETIKAKYDDFLGLTFMNEKGKKYNHRKMRSLLSDYPEALYLYKKGRQQVFISEFFSTTGFSLIGWELSVFFANYILDIDTGLENNLAALLIGAGSLTFGSIYYGFGKRKIGRALSIYNNRNNPDDYSMNFGITPSGGIGLTFNF
jgi:hypothetical protein